MANIKSSKKAIKVIAKKTENNHELKARVKNLIKETKKLLQLMIMKKLVFYLKMFRNI